MKKFPGITLAVALLLLTFSQARAQGFPWNDFERRTLQELVKINIEEDSDDLKRYPKTGQLVFRAKLMPSVVRVNYTGKSRSISEERKKFIELWSGSYGQDPNYGKLFELEYLFKEGQDQYWLPVQKQVAGYFSKELSEGVTVDLYLIRPGGLRQKGKNELEWVFLVEEFLKPKENEWPSP